MIRRKAKSASYQVGYGKPPMRTRFRKGQSGNPGGRPRRTATKRAKALALREAYRTVTVKERGRALALPAIQAILRSQVGLAAKGNVQAQRAVIATIQTIEKENVYEDELAAAISRIAQHSAQNNAEAGALAAHMAGRTMGYTEAAQRITTLLGLDKKDAKLDSEKDNGKKDETAAGVTPSRTTDAFGAKPGAACS